jgi:hypothetical protein
MKGCAYIWVRGQGNLPLVLLCYNKVRKRQPLAGAKLAAAIAVGGKGLKNSLLLI